MTWIFDFSRENRFLDVRMERRLAVERISRRSLQVMTLYFHPRQVWCPAQRMEAMAVTARSLFLASRTSNLDLPRAVYDIALHRSDFCPKLLSAASPQID